MIKRRNELKERLNLLLNAIYLKTDNNYFSCHFFIHFFY